jgi:hypothetical protein
MADGSPGNQRGGGDCGLTGWWLQRCGVGLKLLRRSGLRTGGRGGNGGVVELGDGGAQSVRRKGHYGHFKKN